MPFQYSYGISNPGEISEANRSSACINSSSGELNITFEAYTKQMYMAEAAEAARLERMRKISKDMEDKQKKSKGKQKSMNPLNSSILNSGGGPPPAVS